MSASRAATHRTVMREIEALTGHLVSKGLADDQNFPTSTVPAKGVVQVNYPCTALSRSAALADRHYAETYLEQLEARAFNLKMLDGALIQMSYTFAASGLTDARLAFLPSPDLAEYQNNPDLYDIDTLFADVTDRRIVTVPLRFDFDLDHHVDPHHPRSHLTLGMYKNCRVPATAALTPGQFIDFILRSFYNTALRRHSGDLPRRRHHFDLSITAAERRLTHVGIPPSS